MTRGAERRPGLDGPHVAAVVVRLDEDQLVLVRDVQGAGGIRAHGEVEGCGALYGGVGAVVGDGEELGAAETLLRVAAGGEDGGVVDGNFDGFAGCVEVELGEGG